MRESGREGSTSSPLEMGSPQPLAVRRVSVEQGKRTSLAYVPLPVYLVTGEGTTSQCPEIGDSQGELLQMSVI